MNFSLKLLESTVTIRRPHGSNMYEFAKHNCTHDLVIDLAV